MSYNVLVGFVVFLLTIITLDYLFARRRQRFHAAEVVALRAKVVEAEMRAARAQSGGLDEMPLPLADATIAVFVIDRVPEDGVDFHINATMPVVWMNPRLQRSWRWNETQETWIENTILGEHAVNYLSAMTRDDVFVHVNAIWQEGIHARMMAINEATFATDHGQEVVQSNIGAMHPAICAGMDKQTEGGVWTEIRDLHLRGLPINVDRDVQPGAQEPASDIRNPFEHRRRPIITDE